MLTLQVPVFSDAHAGFYCSQAARYSITDLPNYNFFYLGPPGAPAGVYVDHLSITPYSARVVWTVGVETSRGAMMIGYDIEAESHFHPGIWKVVASGKGSRSVSFKVTGKIIKPLPIHTH